MSRYYLKQKYKMNTTIICIMIFNKILLIPKYFLEKIYLNINEEIK